MATPDEPASASPDSDDTVDGVVDGELVPPWAVATPTTYTVPDPDYTESGVPTFDFVRDKIEKRISTAIGSQELAEETPEGHHVDEMMRKREEAAKKKLEEIRKSMGTDS